MYRYRFRGFWKVEVWIEEPIMEIFRSKKFKTPTGDPDDPKRDMILRCQRIHQRIQVKIHLQSWGQT